MNTATARKLAPKVERAPKKISRTPLAIVKYVPTQRLPRVPLPILCVGIFVLALCALLVINIAISSAQYELVTLKEQSNTLQAENQALTEQVSSREAPQNLASAAAALGMVENMSTATINVDNLTVTGKAQPAVEGDTKGALIPAPAINNHYMVAPSSVPEAIIPAEETVDPGLDYSVPTEEGTVSEESATQEESIADEPLPEEAGELNGGSIPVPAQREPGT